METGVFCTILVIRIQQEFGLQGVQRRSEVPRRRKSLMGGAPQSLVWSPWQKKGLERANGFLSVPGGRQRCGAKMDDYGV